MTFKIEGLKKRPRWYDIKCTCDNSNIEKKFPIAECKHCQFQTQEDLMPRKSFDISIAILDKNGKSQKRERELSKVTKDHDKNKDRQNVKSDK